MVRSQTNTLTRPLRQLREDILAIARAGIGAADADSLLTRELSDIGAGSVRAIAVGKAAAPMARSAARSLGDRLRAGLAIAPGTTEGLPLFESLVATHPAPTEASERAGRRALAFAGTVPADERLLVLLSGGASAMMAVPAAGITLDDKRRTTAQLLGGGADIRALNTVRKHLSAIKGGWLAAHTPAPCRTLAISDVVGDDLSVIGSGPTVADPSTFADALDALYRYGGAGAFPAAVVEHLVRGYRGEVPETPKPGDARLRRAEARVVGGRADAMAGARAAAEARGYAVLQIEAAVTGEARAAARAHVESAIARALGRPRPLCVISSGETTVQVTGSGRGGRNQEFALAAAELLAPLGPTVLASVGTDGVDGPTEAAGAVADSTTIARARAAGLAADAFLDDNNSWAFFNTLGDLIDTGPTGTNVGDLQVFLLA